MRHQLRTESFYVIAERLSRCAVAIHPPAGAAALPLPAPAQAGKEYFERTFRAQHLRTGCCSSACARIVRFEGDAGCARQGCDARAPLIAASISSPQILYYQDQLDAKAISAG